MAKKDKEFYVSNVELCKHYVEWHSAIEKALSEGKEKPQVPAPIVDAMMRISRGLSYNPMFLNYSFREDMIGDALYDCIRLGDNFNPHKLIYKIKVETTSGKFEKNQIIIGSDSGVIAKVKYINFKTGLMSYTPTTPAFPSFIEGEEVRCGVAAVGKVLKDATHTANNPFAYITTIAFNAFLRYIDDEKKESYVRAVILSETPIHEFFEQIEGDDVDLQQNFTEFLRENSDTMSNNEPMAVKRKRKKAAEKLALEELDIEEFEDNTLTRFISDNE